MSKRSCAYQGSYRDDPCSEPVDTEERDPCWKQCKTLKPPRNLKPTSVACEEDEGAREKKRVDDLFSAFSKRVEISGKPEPSEGKPWSQITVAIASALSFGNVHDSPELREILVLCDQRGVRPFRLTATLLDRCQPGSLLKGCHPTRIIWVGEKLATAQVKWSIGKGHQIAGANGALKTCEGLDFNTVIFHTDAVKFLKEDKPKEFCNCVWIPNEAAEGYYQSMVECSSITDELERQLRHPAELLCRHTQLLTRWVFSGYDKVKPLKDPKAFVKQFSTPVSLEVSGKKDGWGVVVEVWKNRGEELSFHFDSMGDVQKTVGVDGGVSSVIDHLKHVLRSEHLVAPVVEGEKPLWCDGLYIRAKFELIATPGSGEHEVGHSGLARIADIHKKAHVQKELCSLTRASPPNLDGMPRLLLCPLYIEFIGFHGKQASLENYEGTCFWGANQTIETHAKLLEMFFPAELGSGSPIEHVSRITFQIGTGDYNSELRILKLYKNLLAFSRKHMQEGIVFAVCAKDIEKSHSHLTYGIFESSGDEKFRRIRTHCKAKTFVSLNLSVERGSRGGVTTSFVLKDSRGRFVHEVYQNDFKHINARFSADLAQNLTPGTVIKIKASAINKRVDADKLGRVYVPQSVYYIHEGSRVKEGVPDDIAKVFEDPKRNGHHLACMEATKKCDEWINQPSTQKWANIPLAKQMQSLKVLQADAAKQARK